MRRLSNKRAKQQRDFSQARRDFVEEYGFCWVCGATRDLSCHEIAKGSHRAAAFEHRFCWLVACSVCNCGPLNDYSVWPLTRQLALKWMHDREFFDVEGICRLRGRAPDAICFEEIVPHICRRLDGDR